MMSRPSFRALTSWRPTGTGTARAVAGLALAAVASTPLMAQRGADPNAPRSMGGGECTANPYRPMPSIRCQRPTRSGWKR